VQVVNEELSQYFRGNTSLTEATARAVQRANVVLSA
jgi:hypothetical protein